MRGAKAIGGTGPSFTQALETAARLPGVRIDRAAYLRSALKRYCTEDQVERAIALSPAAAGVPLEVITQVANTSIAYETSKVTGLSTLAGLPGGLTLVGTAPADLAQYTGHMLRISQKLAYVYGWPDLFDGDGRLDGAVSRSTRPPRACSSSSWGSCSACRSRRRTSPRSRG